MIKLMEVCGTHTAAIFKNGIRSMIGSDIKLISGPGCPVCVTPTSYIDRCIKEASKPNATLFSFGDMFKVPGNEMSLTQAKSHGANVELMYSPFEVLQKAEANPDHTFVIAAVGFETTVPIYALLIEQAIEKNLENVKLITSLKSAIPAIAWVAENEGAIDGFICPGHVSVITGEKPYRELSTRFKKPFVVAGFDAEHILVAIRECRENVGKPYVGNVYREAVSEDGNLKAQQSIEKYFELGDAMWRGLGEIGGSAFFIRPEYVKFDLGSRELTDDKQLPVGCRCQDVIRGRIDPDECPLFGAGCDPQSPVGPCMVSSEGACGIWYQNR